MNSFPVITLQLLIHLKITTQQYYPNNFPVQFQQNPGQRYQDPQSGDYEEEIPYRAGRRKNRYYRSHEKYDRVDDCGSSEECTCPCTKCDNPPPRCKEECDACPPEAGGRDSLQGQPNLIFMPVPYLVMMPSNNSTRKSLNATVLNASTTSTTERMTTRETTTTSQYSTTKASTTTTATPSTAPVGLLSGSSNSYDNDPVSGGQSYRRPHVMESRNLTPIRRTRPAWMPKYGIIPIPDRLAEKLMSQLREIKGLRRRP
ncbi:hypothetical protein K1T71_007661 [Dendrolimus kikuchii]|uniref:Uncharacterized protein n=1 Tax=Dendrolimus kikuchii TaxID=765133 RepID=A0ACC1CZC2_9NEOP|nr:hypothetical protein K1T71_007661 [Dendrolimus kikuchii]